MLKLASRAFLTPLVRVLFRAKVEGKKNVPMQGPVILASNHLSFIDSVVITLLAPRTVSFLAKDSYFNGTGLKGFASRAFFRSIGAIPGTRGVGQAAQDALDAGLEVLEEEKALEGEIDALITKKRNTKQLIGIIGSRNNSIEKMTRSLFEEEKKGEGLASPYLKRIAQLVEEAKKFLERFVSIKNPRVSDEPILRPFKENNEKENGMNEMNEMNEMNRLVDSKDDSIKSSIRGIQGTQYGKGIQGMSDMNLQSNSHSQSAPSIKYDVSREKSFFRNYEATINMATDYIFNYRQTHFDFLTKISRKKFKYLNKWRKMEDAASGLKPYMQEINGIDKRIEEMSDRANKFIENKFLTTFNMQLDKFDLRYIAYPEDRLKLIEKSNVFRNTLLDVNNKITTYYRSRITWLDIISDKQFLMAYAIKLLSFGIFFISLNYAEEYFVDLYVKQVYKSGERAPSLLLFPLLVMGFMTFGNLIMLLVLWYLMFLYKKSTNLFIVDKFLIKGFMKDSFAYMLFVLLISCLVSVVLQNRQYYRYHSEGARATRIVKSTMLYSMIIAISFPLFYVL